MMSPDEALDLVVVWNGTFDGPDSPHNSTRPKPPPGAYVTSGVTLGGRPIARSTLRVLEVLRRAYPLALTHSQIADALGLHRDDHTLYAVGQSRYRLQEQGVVESAGILQRGNGIGGRPLQRFRYVPQPHEQLPGGVA
jgi:hypothetical protein